VGSEATILGYVLAHEIAHVLQGIARHSATGIMRARWTDNDLRQMGIRVLAFTPEDVQLIRRLLAHRDASAGCSELLSAKL
jgi:predicted Zn-dependent protease